MPCVFVQFSLDLFKGSVTESAQGSSVLQVQPTSMVTVNSGSNLSAGNTTQPTHIQVRPTVHTPTLHPGIQSMM